MIDIEILRSIQKKLSRFIYAKGFISWNGIRKACKEIILALPKEEQKLFKDKTYPEFEIFIPLLRNGSAEVCKSNNRATLLFCMNPNTNLRTTNKEEYVRGQEFFSIYKSKDEYERNKKKYKKNVFFKTIFNPMSFLKNFHSIHQQISDFSEQQIQTSSLRFEQNLGTYQYERKNSSDFVVGIYKLDENVWTTPYLVDKDRKIRKIPYYAEDSDSMNLARLYVRIYNIAFTKPIFEFNKNTQELICNRYSELPILLTRALLLFEPSQLTSKEFCTNHPSVPFKNISEDVVKELQRIFSHQTVEIK